MNRLPTLRRARTRIALAVAAAGLVGLTLSGCGATGPASTSGSSAGTTNDALAKTVAHLEKAGDSYPVPTDPVGDISGLAGKTVYYIPITQQAPQFSVTQAALKQALTKAGLKLQVCNGEGTPTAIGACVDQATQGKAAAIITDGIPYTIAANAFDAAQKAGIAVLNTDQVVDDAHPASKTLGYIEAPGSAQMVALADWITLDSGGKASLVFSLNQDGPAPEVYYKAGEAELKKQCPDCKVTLNKISSANFSLVPSSTSSALLKTPDAGYIVSEFEQFVQPTLGGVQQAGKSGSIKGATGAAQLSSLQMLQSKNFLYAAVGQASAYQGWADTDAVLRMLTGAQLPKYTIPVRLFTRDSIKDVKITAAAQASGEWFGPTDFTEKFAKLWGVS
ncbi:sugar ABC transporter substrate-binding protein [Gryllotalpicola ginsengisoli]|uniref:sugar ABC transporter substrate-binding protein n=1 Tax=Gryllotalpicola ginsengisoli TaxID=444608 RepID=UPI0003B6C008|nr:substrate-binding domain-containing protein [Gryllotalpicola ginsengisoli]